MKTIADFNYPTSATNQSYLSQKEKDKSLQQTIQIKADQQRSTELNVIQSMLNNLQQNSNRNKRTERNSSSTAFLTHEVQKGIQTSKNTTISRSFITNEI